MTARIEDADGHLWPITGTRCPVCRMPTDPVLDGGPHLGCTPPTQADDESTATAVELLALILSARPMPERPLDRWRMSGAPLPAAPSTPPTVEGDRTCTDCGQPLPATAGVGITVHVACWMRRTARRTP